MKSRYDFMTESSVVDREDNQTYPDPLSINFSSVQLTEIPKYVEIDQRYIDAFWIFMWEFYGLTEWDDILLGINNVGYLGQLEPGDVLYLVKDSDLFNFATQKKRK